MNRTHIFFAAAALVFFAFLAVGCTKKSQIDLPTSSGSMMIRSDKGLVVGERCGLFDNMAARAACNERNRKRAEGKLGSYK